MIAHYYKTTAEGKTMKMSWHVLVGEVDLPQLGSVISSALSSIYTVETACISTIVG